MKLTIDQIPCDLDPSQRIALDYDAQDLADVRSGNKGHALRLRLPATRTNARIFGFAAEPYTGQRFNAAQPNCCKAPSGCSRQRTTPTRRGI